MEDHEDAIVPGLAERAAQDEEAANLLGQLAAKRKTISDTKETFVPIPGYSDEPPLLLARYRLLEGPELNRIGDRVRREVKGGWDRQIYSAVDIFINACIGIFIDKGNGKPEPMLLNGAPIEGYTPELAEALQYRSELPADAPSHLMSRAVVFGLFANNDVAISEHAYRLNRWFANTSLDVSQDLLGNP